MFKPVAHGGRIGGAFDDVARNASSRTFEFAFASARDYAFVAARAFPGVVHGGGLVDESRFKTHGATPTFAALATTSARAKTNALVGKIGQIDVDAPNAASSECARVVVDAGGERAFHSVHDLVHYAILSQPNRTASLRCIYSICQRLGRIASKHGSGSRLITANEHWKSQIRHALYTSSRFKRLANDDWSVASGHSGTPETTTVFAAKENESRDVSETGTVGTTTMAGVMAIARTSTPSSPPKRRRPTPPPLEPPPPAKKLASRGSDDEVTTVKPRAVRMNSENSALSALTQDGSLFTSAPRGRSMVKEEFRNDNSKPEIAPVLKSLSPERRQVSRSRSQSPEPRASSTLVIVAGLLEQELKCAKVLPRDTRRNRRKPSHGVHAALPSDDVDVFGEKLAPPPTVPVSARMSLDY